MSTESEFMDLVVDYTLETSDHDGYCSDDYCHYNKMSKLDKIKVNVSETITDKNVSRFIDTPKINIDGSYICGLDPTSKKNGLSRHEYRITVNEWWIEDTLAKGV
jgi:hypothetical protein